jgi:putative hydrolase of HD superfamily
LSRTGWNAEAGSPPLEWWVVHDLFQEFELAQNAEAKFATALDNLEVQIQHNRADFSTWEEVEYDLIYTKMDDSCAHDSYLRELCETVKAQAEEKMLENGVDVGAVKQRVTSRGSEREY